MLLNYYFQRDNFVCMCCLWTPHSMPLYRICSTATTSLWWMQSVLAHAPLSPHDTRIRWVEWAQGELLSYVLQKINGWCEAIVLVFHELFDAECWRKFHFETIESGRRPWNYCTSFSYTLLNLTLTLSNSHCNLGPWTITICRYFVIPVSLLLKIVFVMRDYMCLQANGKMIDFDQSVYGAM